MRRAAEASKILMNKYPSRATWLGGRDRTAACVCTIAGEIVLMLYGSAFKQRWSSACSTRVIELLPSPTDIPPVSGDEDERSSAGRTATRLLHWPSSS